MTDNLEAQPEALRLAEWIEDDMSCQGDAEIAAELRRQHAEIQQLKAQQNELREEQRLCMLEASGLANSMFKKHFSHERHYASGEVVWGLCDSVRGVISQIDNMASGLVRPEAQLSARQAAPDGPWKCGNEYLPYHPDASHVDPAYRDGWNDCYRAAPPPPEREPLSKQQVSKIALDLLMANCTWHALQNTGFFHEIVPFTVEIVAAAERAHGIGATNG